MDFSFLKLKRKNILLLADDKQCNKRKGKRASMSARVRALSKFFEMRARASWLRSSGGGDMRAPNQKTGKRFLKMRVAAAAAVCCRCKSFSWQRGRVFTRERAPPLSSCRRLRARGRRRDAKNLRLRSGGSELHLHTSGGRPTSRFAASSSKRVAA